MSPTSASPTSPNGNRPSSRSQTNGECANGNADQRSNVPITRKVRRSTYAAYVFIELEGRPSDVRGGERVPAEEGTAGPRGARRSEDRDDSGNQPRLRSGPCRAKARVPARLQSKSTFCRLSKHYIELRTHCSSCHATNNNIIRMGVIATLLRNHRTNSFRSSQAGGCSSSVCAILDLQASLARRESNRAPIPI